MTSGVSVMVRSDRVALVRREQVRRWLFCKRWRTQILAEKPYSVGSGDTVQLHAIGAGYQVLVWRVGADEPETVLTYGRYTLDEFFKPRTRPWEDL